MSRRASSGAQPGLVKSSSMPRPWAVSAARRRMSVSSSWLSRVARLSSPAAEPVGISPEQVTYRTPRPWTNRRVSV